MRFTSVFVHLLLLSGAGLPAAAAQEAPAASATPKFPLLFEENRGQSSAEFDFVARAGPLRLALGTDRVLLAPPAALAAGAALARPIGFVLEGANPAARVVGEQPQPTRVNYYVGADRSRWIHGVATFAQLRTVAVWPGVDVLWHASGTQLEYDFVVEPGADADCVVLRIDGAHGAALEPDGTLRLDTPFGPLLQAPPATFECAADGSRTPLAARWRLLPPALDGSPRAGFALDPRDATRTLVIDPIVGFTTILGGNGFSDEASVLHVDADGILMGGTAAATDFPRGEVGLFQPAAGARDCFLALFDGAGLVVRQLTFFGGSQDDELSGLAKSPSGDLVIGGRTESTDLPIELAPGSTFVLQTSFGGGIEDGFLAHFASDFELLASTYLGGIGSDRIRSIGVTTDGEVVACGTTSSPNFPLQFADDSAFSGTEGFVCMTGDALDFLLWSTFVDVGEDSELFGLTTMAGDDVAVTGTSRQVGGDGTVLVARFGHSGTLLGKLSIAGSAGTTSHGAAIRELDDGRLAVIGDTSAATFPSSVAHAGRVDCFIAVVDALLVGVEFSQLIGGSGSDFGTAVAARGSELFLAGFSITQNRSFSTTQDLPFVDPLFIGIDTGQQIGWLATFDLAGVPPQLAWCSALPTAEETAVRAIVVDPALDGPVWVAGGTGGRGRLLAHRATGPLAYLGAPDELDPFVTRLDFAPTPPFATVGHVLVTDALDVATAGGAYAFFVQRLHDHAATANVSWELRDAATQATLDFGEVIFPPGRQLVSATASLAGVAADFTIVLSVSDPAVSLEPLLEQLIVSVTDGTDGMPDYDTGGGGGGGGGGGSFPCALVHVVGGTPGAERGLDLLRGLRDGVLNRFDAGHRFTRAYYDWSARAVPWFESHPRVLALLRLTVAPLVALLGMPWLAALLAVAWWRRAALRRVGQRALRRVAPLTWAAAAARAARRPDARRIERSCLLELND